LAAKALSNPTLGIPVDGHVLKPKPSAGRALVPQTIASHPESRLAREKEVVVLKAAAAAERQRL
jgi:hypothetical protein